MPNLDYTPRTGFTPDFTLSDLDALSASTLCSIEFLWDDEDARAEQELALGRNGATKAMAALATPHIEFGSNPLEVKIVESIQFLERCMDPHQEGRYQSHMSVADMEKIIKGNLAMLDRLDVIRPLLDAPRGDLTADTPVDFKTGVFPDEVKPIASHVLYTFMAQFPDFYLDIYTPSVHS